MPATDPTIETWPVADPREVADSAAADAIRELAAHVHAAEARLATMLSELTADGRWNATGDWKSLAHWLVVNCGYTRTEAQAMQRVAEAAHAMPTVMDHARSGRVSLGVAALAARVATPENDATIAQVVTCATPTQAARVLGQYRTLDRRRSAGSVADAAAAPDESAPGQDAAETAASEASVEASSWRTWFDERGNWRVSGCAPVEVGALLDEAFRAACAVAGRSGDAERSEADPDVDPTSVGRFAGRRPRIADALRSLADLVLDAAKGRRVMKDGGEHFGVTVLVDIDTLLTGVVGPDTVCKLESGPHVTPGLVRRLAEEGALQILWHQTGIPLRLGVEARFANRDQRRALRYRDRGCGVPGCDAERHLHAHHVAKHPTGPTDIDNLVSLCSFHHRLVHHGGWTITTSGDQRFVFRDGSGNVVGNRLVDPDHPIPIGDLRERQRALDITGSTPRPLGGFDPLTEFGRNVYLHALLTAA